MPHSGYVTYTTAPSTFVEGSRAELLVIDRPAYRCVWSEGKLQVTLNLAVHKTQSSKVLSLAINLFMCYIFVPSVFFNMYKITPGGTPYKDVHLERKPAYPELELTTTPLGSGSWIIAWWWHVNPLHHGGCYNLSLIQQI